MINLQYVSALAPAARMYVRAALMAADVCGDDLSNAMDSRLCDLTDTLSAQDLEQVALLNSTDA